MGKIKIRNAKEVQEELGQILESLADGPVFVATNKQVRAVLLDLSDYYDLVDEINDLAELLHSIGGCHCHCADDDDELEQIPKRAFADEGD